MQLLCFFDTAIPGYKIGRLDEYFLLQRIQLSVEGSVHPAMLSARLDVVRVVPDNLPRRPDEMIPDRGQIGAQTGDILVQRIRVAILGNTLAKRTSRPPADPSRCRAGPPAH